MKKKRIDNRTNKLINVSLILKNYMVIKHDQKYLIYPLTLTNILNREERYIRQTIEGYCNFAHSYVTSYLTTVLINSPTSSRSL